MLSGKSAVLVFLCDLPLNFGECQVDPPLTAIMAPKGQLLGASGLHVAQISLNYCPGREIKEWK